MARWALVLALGLAVAGCAKQETPIGYDPSPARGPTRDEDPPTGGGGFDFGSSVAKVRAGCTAQQGTFAQSAKVSTCVTRHPQFGATLITLVQFCGGAACRIHTVLTLERADASSWLVPFAHLRRRLLMKFGDPDQNDTRFPADCEKDFADCVKSGKASAVLRWRWDDGHAVMLRIGPIEQIPAAISVSYSDAHATAKQ